MHLVEINLKYKFRKRLGYLSRDGWCAFSIMCTVILVAKPIRIIVKLCYTVGWVDVTWDAGGSNSYRMGAEGKYDLALAPSHDPDKLQKHLAAVKGAGAVGGVPAVGVVAKPKGVTAAEAAKSKVSVLHFTGLGININNKFTSIDISVSMCFVHMYLKLIMYYMMFI